MFFLPALAFPRSPVAPQYSATVLFPPTITRFDRRANHHLGRFLSSSSSSVYCATLFSSYTRILFLPVPTYKDSPSQPSTNSVLAAAVLVWPSVTMCMSKTSLFSFLLAVCSRCLDELVTLPPLRHDPFAKFVVDPSASSCCGTLHITKCLHGVANSFFLILLSSSLLSLPSLLKCCVIPSTCVASVLAAF